MFWNLQKTTAEKHEMGAYSSSSVIKVSESPKIPHWFEIYTLYSWACEPTSDATETWIELDELYGTIFCF